MASFEKSADVKLQKILQGFSINAMNMRDAENGTIMWEKNSWPVNWREEEVEAHIPKGILQCKSVSREMNFSSLEAIQDFRLEQRIYLGDTCIEEWNFEFGFVIPGSTNSWQTTVEAAAEADMMDPEQISGMLHIETSFLDGGNLINKSVVRIFYV
uniref:GMP phosphodiesterase delta subunit domain-containing protein n=1 Tax=Mantoniella antarctica TaxID=81844 RepID=A0A7S0SJZ0_9CHLO